MSTDVDQLAAPDVGSAAPSTRRRGGVRGIAVVVLLVVGFVLAPLSVLAIWTRTTLLDTDNYVATVAPLARNHDVIEAAATRVTDRVMEATDLKERLTDALPARADAAAPAMTAAIEQVVHGAALRILGSDQFATIWEEANRRVQPQVVAALTGTTARGIRVEDGKVVLDLSKLADEVRAKIESLGFDLSARPGQRIDPELVLFHAPNVHWVQDGIDTLQTLAWLLPVLSLLCFGGAIALARRRRRTVVDIGIGVAVGMAVILTAINLGRTPYLGLFPRPEGRLAGGAAYDQVLDGLRLAGRAVFALALVVALGAWLAGPGRVAVRLRGLVTNREHHGEPSGFARWVGSSKVGLRIGAIALGLIALVAIDQPTGWMVLTIALLVLAAIAIIELVARTAVEHPGQA